MSSHDTAPQPDAQNKSKSQLPVFSARRLSISPVQCSKKHARLQDTDTDTDTNTNTNTDTDSVTHYTQSHTQSHTQSTTHRRKRIKTSQDLCGND